MCFYECKIFAGCRDWRWGNFRQHCQREYRTGETCGQKLVYQNVPVAGQCNICEKIATKKRRHAGEQEKLVRWQREGSKYKASMEKAIQTMRELLQEIYELEAERVRRMNSIGRAGT